MATKIFKKLNDASVTETWKPVLESYGADVSNRPWLVDYAHNHAIFDNSGMINETATAPGLFLQQPGSISAMGNIVAPLSSQTPFSGMGTGTLSKGSYAAGSNGSGDKFPSLLPVAIQVAAKTIGFDLVGVVPMDAPVGFLPYLDYVYQGGNTGSIYEPFLVSVPGISASVAVGSYIVPGSPYGDFEFQYVGKSRVSGLPILKVVTGSDSSTTTQTVGDALAAISNNSIGGGAGTHASPYVGLGTSSFVATAVSLVSALENHISGFTSYSDSDWAATDGTGDLQGPFMNSNSG